MTVSSSFLNPSHLTKAHLLGNTFSQAWGGWSPVSKEVNLFAHKCNPNSFSTVLPSSQSPVPIYVLFIRSTKYLLCSASPCSDFDLAGEGIQTIAIMVLMRLPTSPTYIGVKMLQTDRNTGKWVVNHKQKTVVSSSCEVLGTCLFLLAWGTTPLKLQYRRLSKSSHAFLGALDMTTVWYFT